MRKKNIQKVFFFSFAVGIAGNDDLFLYARLQDPQILHHMIFFLGLHNKFFYEPSLLETLKGLEEPISAAVGTTDIVKLQNALN